MCANLVLFVKGLLYNNVWSLWTGYRERGKGGQVNGAACFLSLWEGWVTLVDLEGDNVLYFSAHP